MALDHLLYVDLCESVSLPSTTTSMKSTLKNVAFEKLLEQYKDQISIFNELAGRDSVLARQMRDSLDALITQMSYLEGVTKEEINQKISIIESNLSPPQQRLVLKKNEDSSKFLGLPADGRVLWLYSRLCSMKLSEVNVQLCHLLSPEYNEILIPEDPRLFAFWSVYSTSQVDVRKDYIRRLMPQFRIDAVSMSSTNGVDLDFEWASPKLYQMSISALLAFFDSMTSGIYDIMDSFISRGLNQIDSELRSKFLSGFCSLSKPALNICKTSSLPDVESLEFYLLFLEPLSDFIRKVVPLSWISFLDTSFPAFREMLQFCLKQLFLNIDGEEFESFLFDEMHDFLDHVFFVISDCAGTMAFTTMLIIEYFCQLSVQLFKISVVSKEDDIKKVPILNQIRTSFKKFILENIDSYGTFEQKNAMLTAFLYIDNIFDHRLRSLICLI